MLSMFSKTNTHTITCTRCMDLSTSSNCLD